MKLTQRELATVLAALRAVQFDPSTIEGMCHFEAEAEDGTDLIPCNNEEIDALCEKINFGCELIEET